MFSPETYAMLFGVFKKSEQNKVIKNNASMTTLMQSYLESGFTNAADNTIFQVAAQSSTWGYGFIGYKWKSDYPCKGILFFTSSQGQTYLSIVERDSEGNWTAYNIT